MSNRLGIKPQAAWTDYTPTGPWADGTQVTRNVDGVGFTYLAAYNALVINPNKSASVKDANNFIVKNLPTPTVGGDAANKNYVDTHSGGGGLADAPSDGTYYGRYNATWANVAPLASPALTGTPTSPTPATADNTTKIATTAYVKVQGYITGNQTITLSGDASGSGTTAITTTLATVNANVGTFQGITVNAKGLVTAAANQGYLTGNQTVTLSGDVSGSGTTAITATLATVNSNVGTFQGITVNGKGLVTAAANQNYAPLASPALTGTPTSTTPATADNSTNIATTAFVKAQGYITGNQTITISGDNSGSGTTSIATTTTGLQGKAISTTAPTGGQVLTWNGGTSLWTPTTPSAVGAGGTSGQTQYNNGGAFGGYTMGGDATIVTSTGVLTLATVNSNVGTFQGLTVNAKGLVTAAASIASTTTPLADAVTGAIGSSSNYAKADHVHPITMPFNCGRFQFISNTQVQFVPYNGDLVRINGIVYSIPGSGITATNTSCFINGTGGSSLAASTTYYVYLFNNSGTLTIDFSATGSARDTTTGNVGTQIKSGDSTRSLIGMVYTTTGGGFASSQTAQTVVSWFNRRSLSLNTGLGNNNTSSVNAVYVLMNTTNILLGCFWGEEQCLGEIMGQAYTSTSGCIGSVSLTFDGTASNTIGNQYVFITSSTQLGNCSYGVTFGIAEGAHSFYIAGYGSLNATASTFFFQNAMMSVMLRG